MSVFWLIVFLCVIFILVCVVETLNKYLKPGVKSYSPKVCCKCGKRVHVSNAYFLDGFTYCDDCFIRE